MENFLHEAAKYLVENSLHLPSGRRIGVSDLSSGMLRDAMMRLQSVFRCFTEVAQQVPLISCLNCLKRCPARRGAGSVAATASSRAAVNVPHPLAPFSWTGPIPGTPVEAIQEESVMPHHAKGTSIIGCIALRSPAWG
jgi:hypothetical protein